jgi:3,4-dihydroxy 2-butanone 4-phosphate synthase/GTP cyclohydrolase II
VIVLLMPHRPDDLAREVARQERGGEELRAYGIGAQILADLGVHDLVLLTNTPQNVIGIEGYELSIVAHEPVAD